MSDNTEVLEKERESLQQALLSELALLDREQILALLNVARTMQPVHAVAVGKRDQPYHEASDPAIALISGPTDLAQRAEEILADEIRPHSGWTSKEDAV